MLQEVKRILYASDLGRGSRPAFRHAVQAAIRHDAEIIFFHAIEPMSELTEDAIEDYLPEKLSRKHSSQIMQSQIERIEQRVNDFLQSELECGVGLPKPANIKVMIGSPAKSILKTAKQTHADLIVMGDRESSTISRLFLGSTAQKVIHQSDIPVTIVPLKNEK